MPQKQKLSAEEKAKVIEDYINNRISLSEAARRGGVARDTISQWARNYEADGMAAFMTCKDRVYSPELKRQAVEDWAGMTQSMSRVAHCIDNGPMEGFWGILKRERYYGRRFTSKRELIQTIENYIHYYNTRRVQRNLGILTPMEKHELGLAA